MQHFKKVMAACVAGTLLTSIVAGCGTNAANEPAGGATTSTSGKITDKPLTLTYWVDLGGSAGASVTDYSQVEFYKELEKRTNVKIKFKHPPQGQAVEQFNIMIASRDLPDLIESAWANYPGGERKAADDKIIIETTDLVNKYQPNYKKIMDENPVMRKQVTTEGKYFAAPSLAMYKQLKVFGGPIIRKDLLDQYGLKVPETVDEWEQMLTTFKEKGVKYPLSFKEGDKSAQVSTMHTFIGAFGSAKTFYLENGKMKYGFLEPGFKQYVQLMNKWRKAGLLDPDFATMDNKGYTAKIVNEQVGAFLGYIGGDMGSITATVKQKNPNFKLVGAPIPTLKKGEAAKFIPLERIAGVHNSGALGITTANKHPVETAKWIDYAYSEEGHMLYNFGIEGLTYNMENNYPKFTDLIMKNPDGLTVAQAMAKYTRCNGPTVGYQDERYLEQYYPLPEQIEAAKLWSKDADKNLEVFPVGMKMTAEEAKEFGKIMSNIKVFAQEQYTKLMYGGIESEENYNQFISQLKKMNIDRALEIQQATYERSLKN